jgi:hypothetical protein
MDTRSRLTARRLKLKARLIGNGFTYSSFGVHLGGVSEFTVKAAVRGERNGPKSRLVIDAIERLPRA